MTSSIGGNLETSILMDASGVRMASQTAARDLEVLSGAVKRTSSEFAASSAGTNVATDAFNRAGQIVELLGLKLMTLTNNLESNRRNSSAWSRSVSSANNEVSESLQTLTQAMQGGVLAAQAKAKADDEARTKAEQLAQFQKSWSAEQLRMAQAVEAEQERIRQQEMAALKKDIVDRHNQHAAWISDEARLLAAERAQAESARQQELAALQADIIDRNNLREKDITDRRNQHTAWISDQARLLAAEREQAETARQQELSALRADIIARNNLREQELSARQRTAAARDANVFEDARRFSAGATIVGPQIAADDAAAAEAARLEQKMIMDARRERAMRRAQNEYDDSRRFQSGQHYVDAFRMDSSSISPDFARVARDAVNWKKGQDAAKAMEKSITRMRHELDPMLAMQARMAQEAEDFAANLQLAVRYGAMQENQAENLLMTYKQLQAVQVTIVAEQQRSFAGMRNFGFAAQQFAYAIEDFGQVWGTMGFAGGMRAATNNLTAMLATLNPTLGVMTSISAGLGLVALSIWENHRGADALQKKEEERLKLREKMLDTFQQELAFQRELASIRSGDIKSLGSASGSLRQQADEAAAEARMAQRDEREKRIQKLTEMRDAAAAAASKAALGVGFAGAGASPSEQAIRDMSAAQMESLRVAKETEIQHKFLNHLLQQEVAEYERLASVAHQAQQREEQRQAIVQRAFELQKDTVEQTETYLQLQRGIADLAKTRFIQEENEVSRVQAIVAMTERLVELREKGMEARAEAAGGIQDRFGGINKDYAFEQEQLFISSKIITQMELAVRAGTIQADQAARMRGELERVLELERNRKEALEEIESLQEREASLQKSLKYSGPVGVTSAVTRGSEEALRIIEQDRLRQLSNKESEPIVAELRNVLKAIQDLKDAIKEEATETPDGAALTF